MILGRKSFIREALQRLKDTERKEETSPRRTLRTSTVDLDDIVALVGAHFNASEGNRPYLFALPELCRLSCQEAYDSVQTHR